jgi:hypothetical protein
VYNSPATTLPPGADHAFHPAAFSLFVAIPNITHYGIYGSARAEAFRLALQWFDKYLKPL